MVLMLYICYPPYFSHFNPYCLVFILPYPFILLGVCIAFPLSPSIMPDMYLKQREERQILLPGSSILGWKCKMTQGLK